MINVDWEKTAFLKLARLGAIVFLPTSKGRYLLQVADENDESDEGKLRPPGGGKNPSDKSLRHTIVREIQEEFALSKKQIESKLKFLGYEYRDPFWGNAVFELADHGLMPGEYQASNHHDEKIELVEANLSDPDYVGPDPDLLLTESEKQEAEDTDAETKSALCWDLFKSAKDENLHEVFKPDFSPAELHEKHVYTRLYHKLLPRVASMEKWPVKWTTSTDPRGWLEWYEQYAGGRRCADDAKQIRRWLNFKSRFGGPYKAAPSPRRGWALVNWAIDPTKLLSGDARASAQQAMDDYQQTIDKRFKDNSYGKQAALAGLDKFAATSKELRIAELEDLMSAGHGRWIGACGHVVKSCRCKHANDPDLQVQTLSNCADCRKKNREKQAMDRSGEQGVMSGSSIDGGAPTLLPALPAENDGMPAEMLPKVMNYGARLARLRKRRGELPDGTPDPEAYASIGLGLPEKKESRYVSYRELKDIGNGKLDPVTMKPKQALHERVIYSAREGKCPECGVSENMDTSIVKDKIRCGACGKITSHIDWGVSKVPETGYKSADSGGSTTIDPPPPRATPTGNQAFSAIPQVGAPAALPPPIVPKKLPDTYFDTTGATAKSSMALSTGPSASMAHGPELSLPPSMSSADGVKTPTMPAAKPLNPSAAPKPPPAPIAPPSITDTNPKFAPSVIQDQQASLSPSLAGQSKPIGSQPTIAETAFPVGGMPAISQGVGSLPMATLGPNTPMLQHQRQALPGIHKMGRFHQPENFDHISDLDTKYFKVTAGGNDWEDTWTGVCFIFGGDITGYGHKRRVWANLKAPEELTSGETSNVTKEQRDWGKSVVRKWIRLADAKREPLDNGKMSFQPEHFLEAAKNPSISGDIDECGLEDLKWEESKSATELEFLVKTAITVDSAGIPTTGPEAIAYALSNVDIDKKEAEAKAIIQRKLKSKRPAAVQMLNYIAGMKRTGVMPKDLAITRVPVIPPQFRPYTYAGDTYVMGDANELYRDLINLVDSHKDIEQKLGPAGAGPHRLHVYDAVRAVYGYGEPTSPKTRERGVSGFLKKVTGTNPKMSYPQSRMLAKDMDYVGRSVIGVDPDLGLDEIGIPNEMAWKLYSPYDQRRLVRNGMSPEQAVKYIADRHEQAGRALDEEMGVRPVVYGRQPSWHKYNVVGGWPKRIDGNMIRINALVTTGLNADFDGDTINVHLPSLPDAVGDARDRLMPSKMLFSIKNRNQVVPTPKQEFVLGLYQAQRRPAKHQHHFPDEKSALAAIRHGRVSLSDDVQIGKQPMTNGIMPTPGVLDEAPTVEAPATLDERVTR